MGDKLKKMTPCLIVFSWMLLTTPTFGFELSDSGLLLQQTPQKYSLIIGHDFSANSFTVAIRPNGSVELGPGVTIDEASRRFWDAVETVAPGTCAEILKRRR